MIFERIGASHPLLEASFTLYEASFPPNERRTREDHLRALQDADFFPLGAVEDGKLLADVFLWETEDFCCSAVSARPRDWQHDSPAAADAGQAFDSGDRTAGR